MPFEVARSRVVDWTSGLVWLAIVVANVRHVTVDPELSERYADAPTPDALRRPINVRALAAMTGLTYGTVYRHCQRLAAADVIVYDRDGWLTTALQVNDQQVDTGVKALLGYYVQHINELVLRGLDVGAVADRYLAGRPPYAASPG